MACPTHPGHFLKIRKSSTLLIWMTTMTKSHHRPLLLLSPPINSSDWFHPTSFSSSLCLGV